MDILQDIDYELTRFQGLAENLQKQSLAIQDGPEHCWRLFGRSTGQESDVVHLTFMGIVHGNELAGLRALSEFMLVWPHLALSAVNIQVTLILGNVHAARKNMRFLESDLNRAFAKTSIQTKEHARARELEPLLRRTRFLVDLHQTREPSVQPFFIFPLAKESLQLAEAISESIPIVTHWGDAFSSEGQCTDEFVISQGGCGITIELGRNGFNDFSVSAGLRACVLAFGAVVNWTRQKSFPSLVLKNEIYQTVDTIKMPPNGDGIMHPGFMNFSDVSAGQEIALANNLPVRVGKDGKILFPFYKKPTDNRVPPELCRIMYRVERDQLPNLK